jgi:hypothetical protein
MKVDSDLLVFQSKDIFSCKYIKSLANTRDFLVKVLSVLKCPQADLLRTTPFLTLREKIVREGHQVNKGRVLFIRDDLALPVIIIRFTII